MAEIKYEKQIASIYYAITRKSPPEKDLKSLSENLQKNGPAGLEDLITRLMKTPEAKEIYGGYHNNFEIMFFFFNTIHGRTMGEIEFKLWSNESYINHNLNNNLFKITKELVTNTAPWPQLNDDWSINNSYEYNYPVQRQIDREHFVDNGNQALYPGSPSPSSTNETDSTADIQGVFHILGAGITRDVIEYWAPLINNHERTLLQATEKFINDRPYLSKVTNKTFIQKLFENGYERSASDNELNFYVNLLSTGISRGEIAIKLMNTLKESNNEQDHVAREHLKGASYVYKAGELPPLEYQEFIAELYLAGAGRNLNSEALFGWSQKMASGTSYDKMVDILLNTSEFTRISTYLEITAYAQKVYNFVYGHDADSATIQQLVTLSDKGEIIKSVINSALNTTAGTTNEFHEKFQFIFRVADSLNYKTYATLTNNSDNYLSSSVNSGLLHNISKIEMSKLEKIDINLATKSNINLNQAANIKQISISGNQPVKIALPDNSVNDFIFAYMNGSISELTSKKANTLLMLTQSADITTAPTHFNFGIGNDFLGWTGNNSNKSGNKINTLFTADGGNGVNSISANFINTRSEITITKGINGAPDTKSIQYTSNLDQFKNFSLIDLYKYTGQISTLTYTKNVDGTISRTSSVISNTLDYDIFIENTNIISGGNINQIGKAGFSFINTANQSKPATADIVSVINIPKEAANFYIGNRSDGPYSVSNVNYSLKFKNDVTELNFLTNQKNGEDTLTKSVESSGTKSVIYAGAFELIGENLRNVNIKTVGESNDKNGLTLKLTKSHVEKITIEGTHKIKLNAILGGDNNTTEFTIDASKNSGVDLSIEPDLFTTISKNIVIFGGSQGNKFALSNSIYREVSSTIKLIGGDGDDYFDVSDIVTAIGGKGADMFNIMSIAKNTSTLYDFNAREDIIALSDDNFYISGRKKGEKIPFVDNVSGGSSLDNYGYIEFISDPENPLQFKGKAGVVSTLDSNLKKDTYIVVDLNNNKTFDNSDALIKISGQPDTELLASQLYY